MKKTTFIILFIYLFSIISTRDSCEYENEKKEEEYKPSKKKDCTGYKLTDYEKLHSDSCCYYTGKDENDKEFKECGLAMKKTVTKEVVEKIKNDAKYKEYSIDCNSHWLSISFIFAFLLLLF
jgi:hypothetical protein